MAARALAGIQVSAREAVRSIKHNNSCLAVAAAIQKTSATPCGKCTGLFSLRLRYLWRWSVKIYFLAKNLKFAGFFDDNVVYKLHKAVVFHI